jgi:hypothetical protein
MAGPGPIMSGAGRESPSPEGAASEWWMIVSPELRVVTAMIPCGPGPPDAPLSVAARGPYDTLLRRA